MISKVNADIEIGSVVVQETKEDITEGDSTHVVYQLQLNPRPHVTFDDSVIDNEHLGRKKSNKCCIFHKKREFGESSSSSGEESDTHSSDDESDSKDLKRLSKKKVIKKEAKHQKCQHRDPQPGHKCSHETQKKPKTFDHTI